ncbi:MAG: alpha/beta hydrolase [Oculatellaceae cyanobacterium bins.114]|nr:alpha/beta hydrolase [Oculatellaceae cyanobacterium bins.114]
MNPFQSPSHQICESIIHAHPDPSPGDNPPLHPPLVLQRRSRTQSWITSFISGLMLAVAGGVAFPALAAEQVAVRFGPVRQSVAIADLEHFAKTGEISPALRPYTPFLSADVQQALNSRLQLDPQVGDELVADLLNSSAGERLLNTLQLVISDSDADQLNAALITATQEPNGLSVLGFLQAYPAETITIEGSSAIALASQMNLPYWQSQALSSVLERELTVPTDPATPSSTATASTVDLDPSLAGNQWVRQQTLMFRDYERNRTIPVDLYWSSRTTGPLVVLSHGFGADRRFLGYLAHHLASHGFAVAALEHPASNVTWLTEITAGQASPNGFSDILPATEFIDRPKDVTFLLNELERLNRHSTILRGKLNTDQVVVLGHSLGGYTALALAGAELDLDHLRQFCNSLGAVGLSPADWLQCTAADLPQTGRVNLRDDRVVQVIALNPVIGHLFNDESLSHLSTPILILSGTDDAIMPAVSQQLLPFAQLQTPDKYLLTAIGGTHLSVGDPANLNYALTNSLFVRERPGEETEALRHLLRAVSLAFIKQLTPEADRYKPFLTSAYAQSFSTPTLQLRLNSELPPNLSNWLKMAALPLEQLVSSSLQKQSNAQLQAKNHDSSVYELLKRLPVVMFILPGNFSLLGNQLFKFNRRRRKHG